MKTKMILSLGLMLLANSSFAEVMYSNTADLSSSSTHIKLVDANYVLIPTVTESRNIPGCVVGEAHDTCTEVIVLKTEAVIQANVSYVGDFASEGDVESFATLTFKLSDFSADQVAALKAASPAWKHPFSNAAKNFAKNFAKNNLSLSVKKATKTIQVVDTKNSKLCVEVEPGIVTSGCKEVIAYKNALTTVKTITVSVK